jgi:hypothetical protein
MNSFSFLKFFVSTTLVVVALSSIQNAHAIKAEQGTTGLVKCLEEKIERSRLVNPWDSTYNTIRRSKSKLYSAFPYSIVMAKSESDIKHALSCAAKFKVKVTARGGAHGNAGQSSMSGAIMIDLRQMNDVTVSDDHETVRVQAGATAGEAVYHTSKQTNGKKNLPVGQKPTVGMTGLTLGGGWGFFTRHAGLLCDQLVSLKMITTNGKSIVVSRDQNSDVFWASCGGGGGNVAIVTELTYKTLAVPSKVTMINYWQKQSVEVIDFYQNLSTKLSSNVTLNLEVSNGIPLKDEDSEHFIDAAHTTDQNRPGLEANEFYVEFVGIYLGPREALFADLKRAGMTESTPVRLSDFKSQKNAAVEVSATAAQLGLMGWGNDGKADALLDDYSDQHTYYAYKSYFLYEKLPREAIQLLMNFAAWSKRGTLVWEFQSLGGKSQDSAVERVPPTKTAFSHRNAQYGLLLKSNSRYAVDGMSLFGTMAQLWQELLPYVAGRSSYVNMMDYDIWHPQEAYYGIYNPNTNNVDMKNALRLEKLTRLFNSNGTLVTAQSAAPKLSNY